MTAPHNGSFPEFEIDNRVHPIPTKYSLPIFANLPGALPAEKNTLATSSWILTAHCCERRAFTQEVCLENTSLAQR